MNLVEFSEIVPVRIVKLEALHNILNGSTAEKVLLLKSQLLALPSTVIGVEDTCDVLSSLSLHNRLVILSIIEFLKIKLIPWARSPQTESVGVISIKAWDGSIIGLSNDCLAAVPVGYTWRIPRFSERPKEANWVCYVRALNFPRIAFG